MKVFIHARVNKIHSYLAPGYGYNSGYEWHYIYDMEGEDGKTYVWKTTKVMKIIHRNMDCSSRKSNEVFEGDEIFLVGNFKCESEYKGRPQILINRVEVKERTFAAPSPEEIVESQIASIMPWDKKVIVPYWEYKQKYSDCETIKNSYDEFHKTIAIIIRNYDERMATA